MDLTELFKGLWKQKLLILLCTTVVLSAAVTYAWTTPPSYEAKMFIQPPSQSDIGNLNYGRGGDSNLEVLRVKDVYDVYLRCLQSESLRWELYRSVYMPGLTQEQREGPQNAMFARFSQSLVVAQASKDDPTRFSVTATVTDPQQAAQWVTAFAARAGEQARDEILRNVKSDATIKADNLQKQIDAQQASSRKEREDEIVQLKEALRVAKSIDLEKPPIISGKLAAEVSAGMDHSLMYMRGSKALEAEIDNLQARQSDDPFIGNLRQKQESLAFYRTLEVPPSSIKVYRQDGIVEVPDRPVKPRKMLIVALGLALGFGLGIFLAVLRFLIVDKANERRAV
ncbi:LPS O-antigen chain length determinant protein WzzB [Pseudomonas alkylphenolica]|uniref:LPS O-antigen chain length determinant protein WzzB n=1 Tax=Pseudomonas alkylphenolica TaxID=237609 RepID=UPI001E35BE7D|nr:Wzz/FepE/Etk N-terminal domain-containing protein [Pseudomonas alkylphenolica]